MDRERRGQRDDRPSVSAELFAVPLESGQYLIYAPLRQAAFVGNAATVNYIADLKDGQRVTHADPDDGLLSLLRRLEIVDGGPEERPITEFSGIPEPVAVTLFLTTACNLRCTYCYASAGDLPARFMSLEVAKHGIEHVIENAVKHGVSTVEIGFHGGGEPSVNWQVLTGATAFARERAEEKGIQVHTSLATNGVLSSAKLSWVLANINDVSLSFDGVPEVQDLHRPTAAGRKSSTHVIRTLQAFDAADYPYGIRMTVTADQIEALPDSVEFVCSHFRPRRILVEPAYQLGRWRAAPSAETAGFIVAYREAQQRARAHGQDIVFSGARVGLLTNHFCGVSQDGFSLSPDGNVSACFEAFSEDSPNAEHFFYARPADDGYAFDFDILNKLRGQAVQHRAYCRGCFAKWHCGGDCHYKALSAQPDSEFAGTDRCHIIRELTKDQILDRIAASGGWVWHGSLNTDAATIGLGATK